MSAIMKEIHEAINVGQQLQQSLAEANNSLKSASNWGIADLLGGGLIISAIKHSRMQEARNEIYRSQELLARFKSELGDVHMLNKDIELDVSGFLSFADFFFDGLLADWMVQSRIQSCKERINQLQGDVENAMQTLYRMERQQQEESKGP